MYPGQYLNQGDQIESRNGNFRLVLQMNGKLQIRKIVQYMEGNLIWRPIVSPDAKPGHKLMFELDGNLVLYDVDGTSIWQSNTKGLDIEVLVLQDDGNLQLIDKNKVVQWETNGNKLVYVFS